MTWRVIDKMCFPPLMAGSVLMCPEKTVLILKDGSEQSKWYRVGKETYEKYQVGDDVEWQPVASLSI